MMKASIIISMIFFLFVLATTCSAIQQVTDDEDLPPNTVLAMSGSPVERKWKCSFVVSNSEAPQDTLMVFKGPPRTDSRPSFVQARGGYFEPNRTEFHPKTAAGETRYLTTSTPYGIAFKGYTKFWKLDLTTWSKNHLTLSGANLSVSGTFTMEEVKDSKEGYPVYKLFYHPGAKEIGMQYFEWGVHSLVLLEDELKKQQTRIHFGFTDCFVW